jgi:hypothetical protein
LSRMHTVQCQLYFYASKRTINVTFKVSSCWFASDQHQCTINNLVYNQPVLQHVLIKQVVLVSPLVRTISLLETLVLVATTLCQQSYSYICLKEKPIPWSCNNLVKIGFVKLMLVKIIQWI